MTAPSANRESIGLIVGYENDGIIVEFDTGERVVCRGIRTQHRKLGYHILRIGQRAKIRFADKPRRLPLLVEILE